MPFAFTIRHIVFVVMFGSVLPSSVNTARETCRGVYEGTQDFALAACVAVSWLVHDWPPYSFMWSTNLFNFHRPERDYQSNINVAWKTSVLHIIRTLVNVNDRLVLLCAPTYPEWSWINCSNLNRHSNWIPTSGTRQTHLLCVHVIEIACWACRLAFASSMVHFFDFLRFYFRRSTGDSGISSADT